MWFFIIFIFLSIVASILYGIFERELLAFFGGLLYTLGASLGITFIVFGIGASVAHDETYKIETTEICALADSSGTSGSFFLGSGTVENDMYYYYLTKNDDGSKEMHKIKAENVSIDDTETEEPYIETIYKRNSKPIVRFFLYTEEITYKIHIPPKSIKYEYNIDLE